MRVLLLALISWVAVGQGPKPKPPEYSTAQIDSFWKQVLLPYLNGIINRTTPYPEINQRVEAQKKLIELKFPRKPLRIEPHATFAPEGEQVFAQSWTDKNGFPTIGIAIPAFMAQYLGLMQGGYPKWEESFEFFAIAGIMHELDHFAGPPLAKGKKFDPEIEILANALTTKYVTSVLVEKYRRQVYLAEARQYQAWVQSGRNEKSPIWRKAIIDLYAPLMKK